ncbi:helix-turn-helix domain-containing protein [Geodermatophilus africanus]|nr:helix-turn-helix domain-containing protein [Geodermatophilus africanus]
MDEVATADPGVARRWLEAFYPGYRPEESNSHRGFGFRSRHVRVGSGSLARLRYSLSADNNVVLSDVLVVVQPDDGGMKVSLGRHEDVVLPGSPVLLPAHQVVSVLWADTVADCVSVQTADVERVAVETTGLVGTALRFTGHRPMSPVLGRRWSDAVRRVVNVLVGHPEVAAAPLVASALTQRLARAVLETFPSTTLVSHRRLPPDHATPAVVRRAIEHIEANAQREMTLTEIADAAGSGARGLQASFLRHRDTTPTAFAERVRMARAHRDLVDTDPGGSDSVPTIAARWGFANHRRFAAAYRETYGRLPDETLRR